MNNSIYTVNFQEDSKDIILWESILHDGFKKNSLRQEKVFYLDTIYNLRIRKDPGQKKDGEFGRDRLVNDILKIVPIKKLEENHHLLTKSAKDFLLALRTVDEKNTDFQTAAHLFSDKYSRGALNLFRFYMINHHIKSRDETGLPIIWKDREIVLTEKAIQAGIYKSIIRDCQNPIGLRLCLGYSEAYRYDTIEFDHWLNLIKWNYKNITISDKLINVEEMESIEANGILKTVINFTLFLNTKGVKIFPVAWMAVPSSHRLGTYHLHRAVADKEFQKFLQSNWSVKDFHKALKYGLVLDPWKFIASQYRTWKSKGEKDDSFKWDFIREVDTIIDRFNLTPIK